MLTVNKKKEPHVHKQLSALTRMATDDVVSKALVAGKAPTRPRDTRAANQIRPSLFVSGPRASPPITTLRSASTINVTVRTGESTETCSLRPSVGLNDAALCEKWLAAALEGNPSAATEMNRAIALMKAAAE